MLWDLFAQLGTTLRAHERVQNKFRIVVLQRLAIIENTLALILAGQTAQNEKLEIWRWDKFLEGIEEAQKHIAEHSQKQGLEFVKYVYGDSDAAEPKKRQRKRRESASSSS